ncbi:MAG: cation-translocating P-type ATPase [Candidatus Binatus sp.]|uniref:cation-translocating P-type ATPase n=1 Tax=Candidatus Binatus sp. TaxID=2811406 RepID=UPI00271739C3|nr:cation-translocating P-type ATPase [Candidatus Binatus sp.]MDO8433715.1 cation-translocating P-type ATPase [Candidatus Binatus sp.]
MNQHWHELTVAQVVSELRSDLAHGLSSDEAAARLARDGRNEIRKAEHASRLTIFLWQFESLVIWVLIGAAVVSAALGERVDGAVIIAIVILNAGIGFFQEYRAEQAVAALARLTAPRARVIRDGKSEIVPAAQIVRGDLLVLGEGDLIAADARLVETSMLRTNEAPLTGESEPVQKRTGECSADAPLAERTNMAFLGTSVATGTGAALVIATGMNTEVGHIATLLETASSGETPLQQKLDGVGKRLLWACFAIVLVVFLLGILRGVAAFEMFLGAVSLAVAAIPEGLPAVVTIALALGVQRMSRRNALVRRLPAVETLGCVQVICTDKTGTLTVGEMTARRIITSARNYNVTGEGYSTVGSIFSDGAEARTSNDPLLADLLTAAVACNDAQLARRDGRETVIGDPTEGALLVAGAKAGFSREAIDTAMPKLGSVPFSSDRKRMTVIRRRDENPWAFVKGAPEVILERCAQVRTASGVTKLGDADRARMLEASALMGSEALRVLAFAQRRLDSFSPITSSLDGSPEDIELDLTLLGLVGMQDPPRAEAREAIRKCKIAGIKVVMITGDHPDTARAIGRELGIIEHADQVLVGRDLEMMTDAELADRVERVCAYARTTAEHKLRIVRAWKARGVVVAMTGDGVNDAPALKESSIGVAMGITGTEVTKQTADIIVTDDNFASIVAAVEEGRGIYDNVVKTLSYLMGGNAGELAVMLIAAVIGWPLPLLPIQLLWINLVTDGLPALALATDPIDADVLARPPRDPKSEIMDRGFFGLIALTGCLTAGVAITAFAWELYVDGSVMDARNAAFSALVIAELMRSFGARSNVRTVWEIGLLSNLRLFAVVAASFGLQLIIHHLSLLELLFGIEPVTLAQCVWWIVLGLIPLAVLELRKLAKRK